MRTAGRHTPLPLQPAFLLTRASRPQILKDRRTPCCCQRPVRATASTRLCQPCQEGLFLLVG